MLHDQLRRIAPFSMAEALARHVLTTAEEGQYLQEPLLHCDLLGEAGTADAVAVPQSPVRRAPQSSIRKASPQAPLFRSESHPLTGRCMLRYRFCFTYMTTSPLANGLRFQSEGTDNCSLAFEIFFTNLLKTPNQTASKLGNYFTEPTTGNSNPHTTDMFTVLAQSFSTASTQIHSGPSPRLAQLVFLHLPCHYCPGCQVWSGPR